MATTKEGLNSSTTRSDSGTTRRGVSSLRDPRAEAIFQLHMQIRAYGYLRDGKEVPVALLKETGAANFAQAWRREESQQSLPRRSRRPRTQPVAARGIALKAGGRQKRSGCDGGRFETH